MPIRGPTPAWSRTFVLLAVALLLVGCASRPIEKNEHARAQSSLGSRGPGVGVELSWWVVDDNPFDDRLALNESPRSLVGDARPLAEVLSPYLNRVVPVTRESRQLWKANGFRLISVPREELDSIRDHLRLTGPVQQQFVGESPQWMEAMPGPRWFGVQSVGTDRGTVSLNTGAMRLLMRCWSGPAISIAGIDASKLVSGSIPGAVQVELLPQHVGVQDRGDVAALLKPKPTIAQEGVLFPRLSLEASFATDDALLIVPDSPDAEWKTRPEVDPFEDEGMFKQFGPPLPTLPTIGEIMMTDQVTGGRRNSRVVMVIMPLPPATFNLLGR